VYEYRKFYDVGLKVILGFAQRGKRMNCGYYLLGEVEEKIIIFCRNEKPVFRRLFLHVL